MNEKTKAKQLVEKYYYLLGGVWKISWDNAKECAKTNIDEIILANPHSNPFNTEQYSTMDYWLEVKKEIEKL